MRKIHQLIIASSFIISLVAASGCFNEVHNYSDVLVSSQRYTTLEQAKSACLILPGCQSISYGIVDGYDKVYQCRGYPSSNRINGLLKSYLRTDCSQIGLTNDLNYNLNRLSSDYSNTNCLANGIENMRYSQILENTKVYRTKLEADIACRVNAFCDGVFKINTQGISHFDTLQSTLNSAYYLGRGQLIQQLNRNYVTECFQKQEHCFQSNYYRYQLRVSTSCAGCVEGCRDFATLEEAQYACDLDIECQAITFTVKESGSYGSTGAAGNGYGYQLRGSNQPISVPNVYESSWIKVKSDGNHLTYPTLDYCQPVLVSNSYIYGCVNGCRQYSTLEEAMQKCKQIPSCFGVTLSRSQSGNRGYSNLATGQFGYQLRQGPQIITSHQGESSWLKPNCDYNNNQYFLNLPFFDQENSILNGLLSNTRIPSLSTLNPVITGDYSTLGLQQNVLNSIQNNQQNCYKPINDYVFSADQFQTQIYSSLQDAIAICNQNLECQGVHSGIDSTNYRLAYGNPIQYQTGVSYIRNCNINQLTALEYPTFYSDCYQQGQKLVINQDITSLDMSLYKSLYIPNGYQLQYFPQEDFLGTRSILNTNYQCQLNQLLQQQHNINYGAKCSLKLIRL